MPRAAYLILTSKAMQCIEYRAASHLLFEVIEFIEPRMKADQAYPPVVGVAVMRSRYGIGNEEAERLAMNGCLL